MPKKANSKKAGKALKDLGYTSVYNAGGFGELAAAGVDPATVETWDAMLEACAKIKAAGAADSGGIAGAGAHQTGYADPPRLVAGGQTTQAR